MKTVKLLIILVLFANITYGQSSIPVPEFKNTIIQVDTVQKTQKSLEKIEGELDVKVKGMGYGGTESYLKLSGKTSTVLLEKSQCFFVIKLPDADTDPNSFVELYTFGTKKDRRTVKVAARKMMGKTKNVNIDKVDLSFTKLTTATYLITCNQTLSKGNYGFVMDVSNMGKGGLGAKQSATVFAFDIN